MKTKDIAKLSLADWLNSKFSISMDYKTITIYNSRSGYSKDFNSDLLHPSLIDQIKKEQLTLFKAEQLKVLKPYLYQIGISLNRRKEVDELKGILFKLLNSKGNSILYTDSEFVKPISMVLLQKDAFYLKLTDIFIDFDKVHHSELYDSKFASIDTDVLLEFYPCISSPLLIDVIPDAAIYITATALIKLHLLLINFDMHFYIERFPTYISKFKKENFTQFYSDYFKLVQFGIFRQNINLLHRNTIKLTRLLTNFNSFNNAQDYLDYFLFVRNKFYIEMLDEEFENLLSIELQRSFISSRFLIIKKLYKRFNYVDDAYKTNDSVTINALKNALEYLLDEMPNVFTDCIDKKLIPGKNIENLITKFYIDYVYKSIDYIKIDNEHDPKMELNLEKLAIKLNNAANDFWLDYKSFVDTWCPTEISIYNTPQEADFIHFYLNYFDNLFTYNKSDDSYYAIINNKRFVETSSNYHSFMKVILEFICAQLKSRLKLIVSTDSKSDFVKSPLAKPKAFTYKFYGIHFKDFSSLYLTLVESNLLEVVPDPKSFNESFNNKVPPAAFIWIGDKNEFYQYITFLKDKKIKPYHIWKAAQNIYILKVDPTFNFSNFKGYKVPFELSVAMKKVKKIINGLKIQSALK